MNINWRYVSRGLLLVLLGAIFLLLNLGRLPASFWWNAVSWWPLLLIVPGLALVFGRRVPFSLTLTIALVAVLALTFSGVSNRFAFLGFRPFSGPERQLTNQLVLPPEATAADVQVEGAGLNLNMTGEDIPGINADLGYYASEPEIRGQLAGDAYRLTLQQRDRTAAWRGPDGVAPHWSVQVTNRLPVDLRVNVGATKADLNLRDVKLKSLALHAGAGEYQVKFGKVDVLVPVNVDVAASRLIISIPEGVPVRLSYQNVIGNINGSLQLDRQGGSEQVTANFDESQPGLDIHLSGAVSDITLNRY